MVNREIFAKKMNDISLAYNRKDLSEKNVIEVWYKFLEKFDNDVFSHSVNKYITDNHNPPAISDLITICKHCKHLKEQGTKFGEE